MRQLLGEGDDLRRSVAEAVRAQKVRDAEAAERALRPPASHPCVVCGSELTPTVSGEAFTMHTVIGAPMRRWHSGYECSKCHLIYSTEAKV